MSERKTCDILIPSHGLTLLQEGWFRSGCLLKHNHSGDHLEKLECNGQVLFISWHSAAGEEVCPDCDCYEDEDPTSICIISSEVSTQEARVLLQKIKK